MGQNPARNSGHARVDFHNGIEELAFSLTLMLRSAPINSSSNARGSMMVILCYTTIQNAFLNMILSTSPNGLPLNCSEVKHHLYNKLRVLSPVLLFMLLPSLQATHCPPSLRQRPAFFLLRPFPLCQSVSLSVSASPSIASMSIAPHGIPSSALHGHDHADGVLEQLVQSCGSPARPPGPRS